MASSKRPRDKDEAPDPIFPKVPYDYYKVLGVSTGEGDVSTIYARYTTKLFQVHPDNRPRSVPQDHQMKCESFRRVLNEAKDILTDETKHVAYWAHYLGVWSFDGHVSETVFKDIFDPTTYANDPPAPHSGVNPPERSSNRRRRVARGTLSNVPVAPHQRDYGVPQKPIDCFFFPRAPDKFVSGGVPVGVLATDAAPKRFVYGCFIDKGHQVFLRVLSHNTQGSPDERLGRKHERVSREHVEHFSWWEGLSKDDFTEKLYRVLKSKGKDVGPWKTWKERKEYFKGLKESQQMRKNQKRRVVKRGGNRAPESSDDDGSSDESDDESDDMSNGPLHQELEVLKRELAELKASSTHTTSRYPNLQPTVEDDQETHDGLTGGCEGEEIELPRGHDAGVKMEGSHREGTVEGVQDGPGVLEPSDAGMSGVPLAGRQDPIESEAARMPDNTPRPAAPGNVVRDTPGRMAPTIQTRGDPTTGKRVITVEFDADQPWRFQFCQGGEIYQQGSWRWD
ncbi:MAG: hypothetical protein M1823_000486 [Watsoniomyces obsoletus]|nr:MAG: hypothetical protein M1823_000486 [Watsoniomyces obsoletus]